VDDFKCNELVVGGVDACDEEERCVAAVDDFGVCGGELAWIWCGLPGNVGDLEIWGFGDLGIWGSGDLGIWVRTFVLEEVTHPRATR
jgi:hypothetical protein